MTDKNSAIKTAPINTIETAEDYKRVLADGNNMMAVSGNDVIQNTRDLPEDQREVVRWLYALAQGQKWNLTRLQKETEIHSTTLFRVFKGTYPTKLDNIAAKIATYRRRYEDRASDLRKNRIFVQTSICKQIWEGFDYAAATNTMVCIYGPTQHGKTWAGEEYKNDNNHGRTKLVRLPASAGVQLMMKEFARACFVSPRSCFENLRESVFGAIDNNNLVIVDELHQVFLSYMRGSAIKCLEVIRELHDRTGCGMALMGTYKLQQELMMGDHQDLLQQFKERGVVEIFLPKEVPWADLMLLANAYGLDEPMTTARELVINLSKGHGLKRYALFLRNALALASNEGKPMAWEHFIRAHDIVKRLGKREGQK